MADLLCVYDEGAVENTPLIGAKGFSVLAESKGKKVLFDVGLRDRYLAHNLDFLDIGRDSVDAVAVSQSCPDNCRGINGFLDGRTEPVEIYAPEGLYPGKSGILSKSVGISEENRGKALLRTPGEWTEVVPGIWLSPPIQYADGYSESFLAVEGKNLAVVSGRGYAGPGPILEAAAEKFGKNPKTYVGAVLLEKKKKPVAEAYARTFEEAGCTRLVLNHCTGIDGITKMRQHLGLTGIEDFFAGSKLSVRGRGTAFRAASA